MFQSFWAAGNKDLRQGGLDSTHLFSLFWSLETPKTKVSADLGLGDGLVLGLEKLGAQRVPAWQRALVCSSNNVTGSFLGGLLS